MKNILKRVDFLKQALILGVWSVLIGFSAYAGSFETSLKNSKLYTGTLDILKGSMNVLLVLVILITAVVALIHGIGWVTADQHDKPMKRKALITTIIVGVVVACIPSIVLIIANVYGAKGTENIPTNAIYPIFKYWR
jgi:hypothetical protein